VHPTPLQQNVTRYADAIEAEMRKIGFWQSEPLTPEQMAFTQAFAMDTMSYAQWLQFIFLPRVREAVAANQFPSGSSHRLSASSMALPMQTAWSRCSRNSTRSSIENATPANPRKSVKSAVCFCCAFVLTDCSSLSASACRMLF